MEEPEAFLNGRWIPASAAAIPIGDAGFVLGATVAEQLRTFGGKLFRLEDHLARLQQSLAIVGVDPGMTTGQLAAVARELAARNHRLLAAGDDLGLSILVTPGAYPAYRPSGPASPTVCLHTYPLPFGLWAQKYGRGEALVSSEVEQVSPRSWPPGLKCRSRMHYYLADRRAAGRDPGARALLLDREGFVTEASTANILVFKSPQGLISPPSEKILRGISLAVLVELARQIGIATVYRDLTPQEVAAADEVLLTSTPVCLLPVTRFDGRPIGDGWPGEVFRRLLAAWSGLVGMDVAGQAKSFAGRDLTHPET
jgi:branched-chain amino acid aminotransferase